jgi:hypothetical protein
VGLIATQVKKRSQALVEWGYTLMESGLPCVVYFFAGERFKLRDCPSFRLLLHASAFLFALADHFSELALRRVARLFVWHRGVMSQLDS